MSAATVFVDRDGVLNRKPRRYLLSPEKLELLPGVAEAVRLLNTAGARVYVVTNQRAVALGLLSLETLADVDRKLTDSLAAHGAHLDGIYVCPHASGTCNCRKPAPGLLWQAKREHPEIDFSRSVLVGDSAIDIRAGQAAGCRTILVGRNQRRATELRQLTQVSCAPDATAVSLADATRKFILGANLPIIVSS